jgi:HSP20 family molecular chaperone IbpA
MNIIRSKIFVGLVCFILGVGAVFLGQHLRTGSARDSVSADESQHFKNEAFPNMNSIFDQFYNDDFFSRSHDPFEQMRQMRKRMMKDFDPSNSGSGIFDSWYRDRFGGGDAGDIKKREDKNFIYYDIAIKGVDKRNFNFKIADGQISISGQVENKSEENGNGTYFSSSFHRSFPVPPDVDAKKVQVEQDKDLVTLKFPKASASANS